MNVLKDFARWKVAVIGESHRAPLRLLLDVSPAAAPAASRTGLARVALELGEALARRDDVSVEACAWGWVQATFDLPGVLAERNLLRAASVATTNLERAFSTAWRAGSQSGGRVPRWLVSLGQALNQVRNPVRGLNPSSYDIVHSTYARFPRSVRQWRKPLVTTLHDLSPLALPTTLVPTEQAAITRRIVDGIRPSDWVACVSDHTRRDLLHRHRSRSAERVVVIPNGVNLQRFRLSPSRRRDGDAHLPEGVTTEPFVLTLSSLAPHKNLRLLVEAWPRVRLRHSNAKLVVAGGKTASPSDLAAAIGRRAELPDGIHFTGFVSDEALPMLLSRCEAFLFPSLYEGFGLPVLEAMACGAPVIASNRTSIPEVLGGAGVLLDAEDENAWVDAICAVFDRAPRREPDQGALTRASEFSWDRVAEQYVALYRRAVES
ncbi:MAG TPA: glycosyltransferase family 1 protein [Opitutaceae bacterium]|nr:glycosyltransferase family 1 protein [Opitutaceae bacterium]